MIEIEEEKKRYEYTDEETIQCNKSSCSNFLLFASLQMMAMCMRERAYFSYLFYLQHSHNNIIML